MAADLQPLKYWQPKSPKFGPLICAVAACIGGLPFLSAIFTMVTNGDHALLPVGALMTELQRAAVFTLGQAFISALLVGALSPLFALGIVFYSPNGRRWSELVRTLVFCLPSVVVATGLVLTLGRRGLVTQLFEVLGLPVGISDLIYSPGAVIIANVLMNLPFASFILFRAILAIPDDQITTALYLGLPVGQRWSKIVWPAIRVPWMYFMGMTFLFSMSNFGAISILGGGPSAQTLEMGIYQSIYFNADWNAAAAFAVAHTTMACIFALAIFAFQYRWSDFGFLSAKPVTRSARLTHKLFPQAKSVCMVLTMLAVTLDFFVLVPLLATLWDALKSSFSPAREGQLVSPDLISGFTESLKISFPVAAIVTIFSWSLVRALAFFRWRNQNVRSGFMMTGILMATIIPSMASAFGVIVIRSTTEDGIPAAIWIIGLQAVMAIPIVVNILWTNYSQRVSPFLPQKYVLGLSPLPWICRIEWPILTYSLFTVIAVAFALSMNETAIVSMLGDPLKPVLTTTMIRLMGSYHFNDSAIGSGLLIIVTAAAVFLASGRRGDRHEIN